MALTSVSYIATGGNRNYIVTFPYIAKSHVKVRVNGVLDTAYTWETSNTIRLSSAPAENALIDIKRETPQTPIVNFVDGTTLTEVLLDTSTTQGIYIAQESYDNAEAITTGQESRLADLETTVGMVTDARVATVEGLAANTAALLTNTITSNDAAFSVLDALTGAHTTQIAATSQYLTELLTALSNGLVLNNGKTYYPEIAGGSPTVTAVTSQSVLEGGTMVFGITLSATTASQLTLPFAVSGSASPSADYATPLTFNNGVVTSGTNLLVPSGVSSFTASTVVADDVLTEFPETIILTVAGNVGTGTIVNKDIVLAANAVELWGNDDTTSTYFGSSQGVWNMFVGVGFNDKTYLDPLTRYPKDIPAGVTVNGTIFTDKPEAGYIRPGVYHVTSDKALPLTIAGGNAVYTNIVNGTGTASFTVQPSPNGIYNASTGYTNLSINILGVAGVTGLVKVSMWHEDDTDYKNRGFISTPQWINQVKHLAGLRYMDALSTNRLLIQNPSQLLPENSSTWGNMSGSDYCRHVPLSVLAKREIELFHVTGKLRKVHINLPTGNFILNVSECDPATNAITAFSPYAPTSLRENFTNGQRVVVRPYGTMPTGLSEGLYYLKWDGTTLKLSTTLNGADVDLTSNGSFFLYSYNDPAALYLAAMQELYNVTHTIDGVTYLFRDVVAKLILEIGNEPWNGDGAFKTFYICGAVGSHLATGAFGNDLEGLKYFSLKGWKAAQLAGWPDAKIDRTINCQVAWPERMLPMLNLVDTTGILSTGVALKDLNVSLSIAPYFNVGNQATGTSYNMIGWAADGAMAETDAQWRDRWLYGITLGAAGVARFCSQARAIKADIRIISYEGGSHDDFFFTYEEWAGKYAMGKRINNFLHYGEYAAEIHQAYYDQVFVANGVLSYNQYYITGHYSLPRVKTNSTSTHSLTNGSKVFAYTSTVDSSINVGDQVEIRSASSTLLSMSGIITAHTPGASFTVNITKALGSGSYSDWIVGSSLMSPWGMARNNYEPDNAVFTWWKNLVPYGLDSGVISGISSGTTVAEGGIMAWTVTLNQAYTSVKRLLYAFGGQAAASDLGSVTTSNGVSVSGKMLVIPVGVTSFVLSAAVTNDTTLEYNETVTLTVDGVTGTNTIEFNDGGAATPDYAYIDDVINKTYPAVSPVKISNTEEEVTWNTNPNWYFDIGLSVVQSTKPGTPFVLPVIPVGATIAFAFETWTEVETATNYFNYQVPCTRKSDSAALSLTVSQSKVQGTGAYAGTTTLTITNNTGEEISPVTHSVVLRVLKSAASTAFKQRIRNFFRAQ